MVESAVLSWSDMRADREASLSPVRFDNTSLTVLHEKTPHAVSLLNCTRHLVTSADIDPAGRPSQPHTPA